SRATARPECCGCRARGSKTGTTAARWPNASARCSNRPPRGRASRRLTSPAREPCRAGFKTLALELGRVVEQPLNPLRNRWMRREESVHKAGLHRVVEPHV